jgi:hypothetical protein
MADKLLLMNSGPSENSLKEVEIWGNMWKKGPSVKY